MPIDDLFDRVRGDANRPLLDDPDPKAKLAALLAERRERYAQADARITSTNAESPEVTAQHAIEALIQVIKPALEPVVHPDRN